MKKALFVRFPEGRVRALTFSYDDGVISDKRMVELLDRHGMKGTFNLNSGLFRKETEPKDRRMTEREIVELFKNGNHEVACHGLTHPYLQEKLPWGLVPYVQALLLARHIRSDLDAYPPFLWK